MPKKTTQLSPSYHLSNRFWPVPHQKKPPQNKTAGKTWTRRPEQDVCLQQCSPLTPPPPTHFLSGTSQKLCQSHILIKYELNLAGSIKRVYSIRVKKNSFLFQTPTVKTEGQAWRDTGHTRVVPSPWKHLEGHALLCSHHEETRLQKWPRTHSPQTQEERSQTPWNRFILRIPVYSSFRLAKDNQKTTNIFKLHVKNRLKTATKGLFQL